ncbi:MAG: lytic transglycosylase domain-containing protein [Oscillospiraceae bacterium]|nr:lytic transglycosylase domain-containing protein [Oscillospiraceae bacterium]
MSDLAAQIVAAKLQQINTKLNARMQEISGRTGISFSDMFVSRLNDIAQDKEVENTAMAGDTDVAGDVNPGGSAVARSNYDRLIDAIARKHGVSAELARAVVWAESNFNPNTVSRAGAVGLMQLMPSTANLLGVEDSFDPVQNIDGGVRYLASKLKDYGGDVLKALAAYNCGPTRLSNLGITDLSDPEQFALLPKETQNYITRIENYLENLGINILSTSSDI